MASHLNIWTGVSGRKRLQKGSTSTSMRGGDRGAWVDEERKNLQAYEYLCHMGEAKEYGLMDGSSAGSE
jgi:Ras GTPase-activating-like protein IQGAP2/3